MTASFMVFVPWAALLPLGMALAHTSHSGWLPVVAMCLGFAVFWSLGEVMRSERASQAGDHLQ